MNAFDEAWLAEYNKRRADEKPLPKPSAGHVIEFTLPIALPGLNTRDRTHWVKLRREKKALASRVLLAIGYDAIPARPWRKVRVTITRHSAGVLDRDNAWASVKALVDTFCARSDRHPHSLGICVDDSEAHMDLIVRQAKAPRGKGYTTVRIEPIV